MTLVEGVADEICHFLAALVVIIVVYVAWWTTRISDRELARTVLLLDRRRRSNRRLTHHTQATAIEVPHAESSEPSDSVDQPTTLDQSTNVESTNRTNRVDVADQVVGVYTREEQVIIEAMDANTNELRQRKPTVTENRTVLDESSLSASTSVEQPIVSDQSTDTEKVPEGSSDGTEVEDKVEVDTQEEDVIIRTLRRRKLIANGDGTDSDEVNTESRSATTSVDESTEGSSNGAKVVDKVENCADSDENEANISSSLSEESSSSTTVDQPISMHPSTDIRKALEKSLHGAEVEDNVEVDTQEEQVIIETMDDNSSELRQRKPVGNGTYTESGEGATKSQTEHSKSAELPQVSSSCVQNNENGDQNGIEIKLKYLNDQMKIVSGSLEESLDEFKKRHFPDLSANKIVKLIFNGHVLQPDTQTLKNCGLFHDCVVHCLIHNKKPQSSVASGSESQREVISVSFPMMNQIPGTNNDRNRDWDLGNLLFALLSLLLLLAWYFRTVYAHMYTATATAGLVLVTGIFIIFIVGTLFPDDENIPNPTFLVAREREQPRQ